MPLLSQWRESGESVCFFHWLHGQPAVFINKLANPSQRFISEPPVLHRRDEGKSRHAGRNTGSRVAPYARPGVEAAARVAEAATAGREGIASGSGFNGTAWAALPAWQRGRRLARRALPAWQAPLRLARRALPHGQPVDFPSIPTLPVWQAPLRRSSRQSGGSPPVSAHPIPTPTQRNRYEICLWGLCPELGRPESPLG